MRSTLPEPALLPGSLVACGLGDRIRPGVEAAGLAVGLDVLGVELRGVVAGCGERLVHHDRRQTTLVFPRLVTHMADGVAALVVEAVLRVRTAVPFEGHGSPHPARLVDKHPRLPV